MARPLRFNDVARRRVLYRLNGNGATNLARVNFDGSPTSRIIQLNSDGSRDTSFVVGAGAAGDVESLAFGMD